jgi:hypothetical protein
VNDRKLARFFGKVAALVRLGLPQPVFDITHLAKAPPEGGLLFPGVARAFMGGVLIDPPVAGFAIGDLIWQAPADLNFKTVTATMAPDPTRVFNPGVYTVGAHFQMSSGAGVKLHIVKAGPTGDFVFSAGTDNGPMWMFYGPINTNAISLMAPQMVYMDRPWLIQMFPLTALADAQAVSVALQVLPVHLLDDGPSAL